MPNHVKNKMTISGSPEIIDRLLAKVTTSDSEFDFNGIIPMPKSLNIEDGTRTDKGERLYRAFLSLIEQGFKADEAKAFVINGDEDNAKTFELGRTAVTNKRLYGARSWYDWSCDHWGTKWNAYEVTVDRLDPNDLKVEFLTAWSEPEPIFHALNEQYPDLDIYVEFANEDLGEDCGVFLNGDIVYYDDNENSFEFAADIWEYSEEEIAEMRGE